MLTTSLSEFIYLSPLLILSCSIILLLLLLLVFRVGTKTCAIVAIASLSLALVASSFLGYQILSQEEIVTDSSSVVSSPSNIDNSSLAAQAETATAATAVTPTPSANSEPAHEVTDVAATDTLSAEAVLASATATDTDTELTDTIIGLNLPSKNDKPAASATPWQATNVTVLFTCDGYGLLYTSIILIVSIIVAALAYKWLCLETVKHGLFYLILLLSALGGTTLLFASHLISLFIGMELLSIPFIGLIGYKYTQKNSLEAAIKYMILSAVATAFLLMGIAFYYAATGELTFSGLSFQLSTISAPGILLLMGVCLILVGIGFKLSLVPFQLWLPDVYQGAPTAVSLLLTTVGKVAIFCSVARLFLLAPIVNNETIRIILVVMAFCSIIWGNFFALMQKNVKRLLAYSSIAHFGYLLIALIAVQYQVLALETIGVYLISYILANICVLGVMSLDTRSHAQQEHESDVDLCGLFWRRPIMALAMGIGLLSLAGVPLTAGFIGRFSLLLLGITAELWWLVGAIVIGSAFGLYFYTRLTINLYLKPSCKDEENTANIQDGVKTNKIGVSEVCIIGSALLILLCGIYPKWLFSLVSIARYLTP